ncbi:MAG: MBL fold metallo-hydrolase [Bacteroidetes bacterium]|nr:MBL fold metallo-hydrolase [Bacteroidota bacterium]MCL5024980.1 MBL fold metallo-hydrolase [Chloroflexota bacterium]
MIVKMMEVGYLATNCYLVVCPDTRQALVIDPGGDADVILAAVQEAGAKVQYIVDTHGHFDHILANAPVQKATGARIAIHPLEAPRLAGTSSGLSAWVPGPFPKSGADLLLNDDDTLQVGTLSLKVLHTPGHAPGHITMAGDGVAFVGDVLFRRGVGRWDLEGGDYEQLIRSIQDKLLPLGDDTLVYPGHGPATTIGEERRENPWLS